MPSCSTLNRYLCQLLAMNENSGLIVAVRIPPELVQFRIDFGFMVHHKFQCGLRHWEIGPMPSFRDVACAIGAFCIKRLNNPKADALCPSQL